MPTNPQNCATQNLVAQFHTALCENWLGIDNRPALRKRRPGSARLDNTQSEARTYVAKIPNQHVGHRIVISCT